MGFSTSKVSLAPGMGEVYKARSKRTKPQPSRPTGSRLLFVGHDSTEKQLLYTVALDVAGPAQPLGTHRRRLALLVTGQPIGRILGQGKLKPIDIETGQIRTLADAGAARGGTWNRDDIILFAPRASAGLYRISAAGGQPTQVKIDTGVTWFRFSDDQEDANTGNDARNSRERRRKN